MTFFRHDLGDGLDLVPRTESNAQALCDLANANLERLSKWEPWAQAEQTLEGTLAYAREVATNAAAGKIIACVIRLNNEPIGAIDLRIDATNSTGELGYWIAAGHEGRGIMRRAADALLAQGEHELGLQRFELHAAADNARSRGLAERLGFELEGIRRRAYRVGDDLQDMAWYARLCTAQ